MQFLVPTIRLLVGVVLSFAAACFALALHQMLAEGLLSDQACRLLSYGCRASVAGTLAALIIGRPRELGSSSGTELRECLDGLTLVAPVVALLLSLVALAIGVAGVAITLLGAAFSLWGLRYIVLPPPDSKVSVAVSPGPRLKGIQAVRAQRAERGDLADQWLSIAVPPPSQRREVPLEEPRAKQAAHPSTVTETSATAR